MPQAQIRFTTNGLLMKDHIELVDFFESIGNVVFKISVHVDNPKIEQAISEIQQSRSWQPVQEHGIVRWKTDNNLRFQINRPEWFYKTYRGEYDHMQPHHNRPEEAFDACVQQTCPLLHQGRIYKCSTSALTKSILERFDNPHRSQWGPYLETGISWDCPDQDLKQFVNNFGKPNPICGQCPTKHDLGSRLDHKITVTIK
jgi:hypothetical protein